MGQVISPPPKKKFPLLQYTFTALIFSTTPSAFRALSKVYFGGSQIICQTGLFLPLLKTLPLNRYTSSSTFQPFSPSFQSPPFLNLFFPLFFFFNLSLRRNRWESISNVSYFSSCFLFSGLCKEPNAQNEVKISCACISILRKRACLPNL